ncbi:hypothetical protein AUR64_08370 [Haloprofundus marisrubri]|uniref:Uncharacterized protein n=1 Tax=Haloprofundus marisrubri TaxID=1514971 RepID=A0A0W1R894_9EURY|nr:hypothetical protein [Haloprofundus marisrubri]KTG09649.1 hypothetical protein AUR64_08370 [Haloprofundus marisrubri]
MTDETEGTIREAKRVARALLGDGDGETVSSNEDTESFDVERFLRTLAGQDTEQSRERRTGKQLIAASLVVLGVLRRLSEDERVGQLRSRANGTEAEPKRTEDESSGRSVTGTLLRLVVFAVAVALVAYVIKTRRGTGGDELVDDETERDIADTGVAEENVMGTESADESDVDEMVDAVEDDEGDRPPEPGETVVEDDVVEAATENGESEHSEDGTPGEAALEKESVEAESDDSAGDSDTEADSESDATEGESPLEADDDADEATSESPNQ